MAAAPAAGMAGALWLAAEAATAVGATAAAAMDGGITIVVAAATVSGPGLDPLAGGGEKWAPGA